ncbi:LOW QUALITY PROTEIN: dickkopf-related protein 3-like [Patiria miniata]|uniref:Dickkopf N-terminal cysteine-rich domain-containing protein n=1 Tax=Patiria miniata TaxID=46514 RepID=A0A914BJ97_PATMI|nr:LOW QUALITY PROTEIN: dickkopf-related protein 3-like [Patiria miniata]
MIFQRGNCTTHPPSRKIGDVTLVVNTTIDSARGEDGVMITFQTEVKPPPNAKVCKTDKNCDKQQFCHREIFLGFDLSYCMACSKNGDRCHADSHCCDKSLCRWGRCREGATSGQIGTICVKDSGCGENECCALVEGIDEAICRPLATEGQHCCSKDEAENLKKGNKKNKSSLSLFEKFIQERSIPYQGLPFECLCIKGLKCVNYGQTFVSVFDLPEAQYGGVCVPGWAQPDRPVAPTLDEISRLQAEKIEDVIGGKKEK